jgi:predicted DsbA family dithiol-disulfide isomerase
MTSKKKTVTVEVVADFVCPWCWIGKRRLEAAKTILRDRYDVVSAWKPFELNAGLPPGGMSRVEYRKLKFGSVENSRRLDGQVAEVGKAAGADFDFEAIAWTPSTIECHRLMWLAGREGKQDDLAEYFFSAYFHDGRNIGERGVLLETAEAAGIDRSEAERFLDSDEGRAEVTNELRRARQSGITGVPTFMVNGQPVISGAVPHDMLARAIIAAVESS